MLRKTDRDDKWDRAGKGADRMLERKGGWKAAWPKTDSVPIGSKPSPVSKRKCARNNILPCFRKAADATQTTSCIYIRMQWDLPRAWLPSIWSSCTCLMRYWGIWKTRTQPTYMDSPIGMYLYTYTHMYAEIVVMLLLQCLTGPREDKPLQ